MALNHCPFKALVQGSSPCQPTSSQSSIQSTKSGCCYWSEWLFFENATRTASDSIGHDFGLDWAPSLHQNVLTDNKAVLYRGDVKRKTKHRVTFYINPNDPDGQRLVLPGLVDDDSLTIAAGHFGCRREKVKTSSRMVTEDYLNALPEYDG